VEKAPAKARADAIASLTGLSFEASGYHRLLEMVFISLKTRLDEPSAAALRIGLLSNGRSSQFVDKHPATFLESKAPHLSHRAPRTCPMTSPPYNLIYISIINNNIPWRVEWIIQIIKQREL